MKQQRTMLAGLLLGLLAAASSALAETPDYAQLRSARAQGLTQPYGWFSLVALEWIKPGSTTVGSARDNNVVLPGLPEHLVKLDQTNAQVTLTSFTPSLLLGGKPVPSGDHPVVGKGEDDAAALVFGKMHMWVIERGGQRYLRVKDPQAPALVHFHGLRWYAPNARYSITARWVPYPSPHTMHSRNKLGQIEDVPVPGHVEFTLGGKTLSLTPLEAGKDGLWFVFRDTTSRQTTDGGGRFLTVPAPSNGLDKPGTVVLDFNQAVNPPCAYSPYATCPLASPENRLPVAVPAGEKRYED